MPAALELPRPSPPRAPHVEAMGPSAEQAERERLAALDLAFADGWARCAPELRHGARAVYLELEEDWRALKPELLASWASWRALPGVTLDEAQLDACRETFARGPCAAMATAWHDCVEPFVGTLVAGEPCVSFQQCASNTCHRGRCAPDDECHDSSACGPAMRCVIGELGSSACMPTPMTGEPCLIDYRCADDHWCDGDGRCQRTRQVAVGAPCRTGRDLCPTHAWCIEGRCEDMSAVAAALEPLRDEQDVAAAEEPVHDEQPAPPTCLCDPLVDGMACVEGEQATRCLPVRYAELGAPCDDSEVLCRGLLRTTLCKEGLCVRAGGPGDACVEAEECRDHLRCVSERCAEPLGPGEPCESHDECAFGLACTDGADDATQVEGGPRAVCDLAGAF